MEALVLIRVKNYLKIITISFFFFGIFFGFNYQNALAACPLSGVAGGAGGSAQSNGSAGACGGSGSSGGGGGGSAAGGSGSNGGGGTLVLKNTSGSMTVSGTIDARGGSSSTTNGGTVKLFYTGSAPSTSGVSSGRTYSSTATTQLSDVCIPSISSDNSSLGTIVWSSTNNALSQDSAYASTPSSTSGNTVSHYITLTGCNFNIPSSATITGVRTDFYRYGQGTGSLLASTVADNSIKLIKGGTIQGTDKSTGALWPDLDNGGIGWNNFGSSSDLWGLTLTASDVNASNFGVASSATQPFSSGVNGVSNRAFIDATHITVYYTMSGSNSAPAAPTLIAPSSGATGQVPTPTFQLRTTDADNDYLKYKIIVYNSDCSTGAQTFDQTSSQTGWSGQDQQANTAYTGSSTLASSTIANFSGVTLSGSTQYCWKAAAIDPGGSNGFGSFSSTQLFTTAANSTPSAPTLIAPSSGATGVSTGPLLQIRSSDADNDYLRYKILLYNSDCSTGLQTFDQTSSQTGWNGQDLQGGTAYTGNATIGNSTIATYGAASLSANTQYCWKAAAIDPAGTNTFSSFSGTQLFTTGSATGQVQLNGGTQINGGTLIR